MLNKIEVENNINSELSFKTSYLKFDYKINRHYEEDKIKKLTISNRGESFLDLITVFEKTLMKECKDRNSIFIKFMKSPTRRYILIYNNREEAYPEEDEVKSPIITFDYGLHNEYLSNGLINEILTMIDFCFEKKLDDIIKSIKIIFGDEHLFPNLEGIDIK